MRFFKSFLNYTLLLFSTLVWSQEIELFQQFNGRFDYLSFGNTLNIQENGGGTACDILSESAADFELQPGQQIVKAYLYWAGSGTGDLEVALNGTPVASEREFSYSYDAGNGVEYFYFAAQADVTTILTSAGNGSYTLSDLDLFDAIQPFCQLNGGNATNFGGWAVTVIFEDASLTLNQVNLFDGFESVSSVNNEIAIELNNLNVLDNNGAKIGFLAWEGDVNIANNETLRFNNSILSNALNPADNQFNGTNSFTGSSEMFNMDIDFYDIENNIQPGDQSALVRITSNQDLVLINNVVTVLNTELPDATIEVDNIEGGTVCGDRELVLDYTVYNINSTAVLPANTPIAFYANSTLMGQSATQSDIAIDGQESGSITLTVPNGIPADFQIRVFVDDDGNGNSTVNETNEDNNFFFVDFHLLLFPEIVGLRNIEICDAIGVELFNLTSVTSQIDPINTITYHISEEDAENNVDPIPNPEAYGNIENPQTIWIRVSNPDCFVIDSFEIEIIICPLPDATIAVTNDLNACRKRDLQVDYLVSNVEATGPLPAATPIAFYVDGLLLGQAETQNIIPIGGSEPGSIVLMLTEDIPDTFTLLLVADDIGDGTGVIEELNEFNNEFDIVVQFGSIPPIPILPDLEACDTGNGIGIFNLRLQDPLIATDANDVIDYFTNFDDAVANVNAIADPEQFQNLTDPQAMYVRQENEICFAVTSFLVTTIKCEPTIYEGMSPEGDGKNDVFIIEGLIDVFKDFNLKVYSREGNLIYEGGNEDGLWDGIPNTGLLYKDALIPVGTYYYVLQLNDPKFPDPYIRFIYVNY